MSIVTNILVMHQIYEGYARRFMDMLDGKIARCCASDARCNQLRKLNPYVGGCKAWEWDLWGGAFNCFDEHDFIQYFNSIELRGEDRAILFLSGSEDIDFHKSWIGGPDVTEAHQAWRL